MKVGALFWGMSADIIGRKFAFNFSLIISSIFCIVAGASPNWIVLGLFVCLSAFGSGGNLVLDTAVFLEYLPSKQQWLLTTMAAWWGLGQMVAGLFAWAYLPNFSCPGPEDCHYGNNKGWRYIWYTSGALVFVMSILRITVIRLRETPKFLLGEGKDEEVVDTLQFIATKYNRNCSLTIEQLRACGITGQAQGGRRASLSHAQSKWSPVEIWVHLKGLFVTKRIGLSTSLIWFSWLLIGLAYPLYNVFLPTYLSSRGADTGDDRPSTVWRNYTLSNFSSIWGPFLAGWMCSQKIFWGRRGTMIVGALVTMVFFFCYTQVRTPAENVGFTCAISFCLNIYYGTLYAYTPEVLPSAHRGTGNGIAIGINRIMGIMSAVIATYANVSEPLFVCTCVFLANGTNRRKQLCQFTFARLCTHSWLLSRQSCPLSQWAAEAHRRAEPAHACSERSPSCGAHEEPQRSLFPASIKLPRNETRPLFTARI